MALRAGYYGLKNVTKKALEKLVSDVAGMKIIKSFGDGLNLTNAGKLNLVAGSEQKIGGFKVGSGLAVDDGVLSVSGGSSKYDLLHGSTTMPDYATASASVDLSSVIDDYDTLLITVGFTEQTKILFTFPVDISELKQCDSNPAASGKVLYLTLNASANQVILVGYDNGSLKFSYGTLTGLYSIRGIKY